MEWKHLFCKFPFELSWVEWHTDRGPIIPMPPRVLAVGVPGGEQRARQAGAAGARARGLPRRLLLPPRPAHHRLRVLRVSQR